MRRHPSKALAPYQSDRCRATSPEVSFPASPPTCGSGHKQMLAAVRFYEDSFVKPLRSRHRTSWASHEGT